MGRLTTHVLDTAHGVSAKNIKIELFKIFGKQKEIIASIMTNDDGRCEKALLEDERFTQGEYELVFAADDYFRTQGVNLDDPPFPNQIVIRFNIANSNQHYHVPLLMSPYSYSTYRGS